MDEGVAAVRLQFPTRVNTIDELASWNDVFCEICRDFAEAQTELARWKHRRIRTAMSVALSTQRSSQDSGKRSKTCSTTPQCSRFITHPRSDCSDEIARQTT